MQWVVLGDGSTRCQGSRLEQGRGLQRARAAAGHPRHRAAGLGRLWDPLCMGCAEVTVACGACGRHGAPSDGSRAAGAGCWVRGGAGMEPERHGLCLGKAEPLSSPSCLACPRSLLYCRSYRIWPPGTPTWSSSHSVGAPRWGSLALVPLASAPVLCTPWEPHARREPCRWAGCLRGLRALPSLLPTASPKGTSLGDTAGSKPLRGRGC